MRYLILIGLALAAGCVNGESPTEPCPNVVVYMSVDSTATLVTDSIDYTPDCG